MICKKEAGSHISDMMWLPVIHIVKISEIYKRFKRECKIRQIKT